MIALFGRDIKSIVNFALTKPQKPNLKKCWDHSMKKLINAIESNRLLMTFFINCNITTGKHY